MHQKQNNSHASLVSIKLFVIYHFPWRLSFQLWYTVIVFIYAVSIFIDLPSNTLIQIQNIFRCFLIYFLVHISYTENDMYIYIQFIFSSNYNISLSESAKISNKCLNFIQWKSLGHCAKVYSNESSNTMTTVIDDTMTKLWQ